MKISLIHGPNLNMLGKREPSIYGSFTLDEINKKIAYRASLLNIELDVFQSNSEGDIISKIQSLPERGADGLILNAGAYTHTSIAIRDAILAVSMPFVEVHLSNIYKREEFRKQSYLSDIAIGVVSGLGVLGYECALEALAEHLRVQERV